MVKFLALFFLVAALGLGGYIGYKLYLEEVETIEISANQEYKKDGETYRMLSYTTSKFGEIEIRQGGLSTRVSEVKSERMIPLEEGSKHFTNFFDYDIGYSIKDGVYITYFAQERLEIQGGEGFYLSDLEGDGITPDKNILFKDKDTYFFSEEQTPIELVSVDVIESVKDKGAFLRYLRDDFIKSDSTENKDFLVSSMIRKAESIVRGKENKAEAIYNWTVGNLTYDISDIENRAIFSGVETYKSRHGVCDGYTKLFIYFLLAVGYEDVEQIAGTVLNSEDFGIIGHAWVRIGDLYYDPTFEDKERAKSGIPFYYGLPKEVLYADRIESLDIPEKYLDLTEGEREHLVLSNYGDLLPKYDSGDYRVLSFYEKRFEVTKGQARDITLNDLADYYGYTTIDTEGRVVVDGLNKTIKSFSSYTLVDDPGVYEAVTNLVQKDEGLVIIKNKIHYLYFNIQYR